MSLATSLFAPDSSDSVGSLSRGRARPVQSAERESTSDVRERTLIAQIRAGDVAAFKVVYVEHYADLLEFAHSIVRARDEAEDVVQQVFAEVWERRMAWHPHRIVPALVRAVRHRALDVLRRTRRQDDSDIADIGTLFVPADVHIEYDELERTLVSALMALPERRRTALVLRAVRQMSYAEVGEVLEISEKAAFILVSRARAALEPIRVRFLDAGRISDADRTDV